jgi:hypothetical protein
MAFQLTSLGLISGITAVTESAAFTVPAAGSQFPEFTLSRPGYLIVAQVETAADATSPFLWTEAEWHNPAASIKIAQENWYIPAVSAGTFLTYGKGPVKGATLILGLKNTDPAQAMTVTLSLYQTTHHIARDDWRSDSLGNVPGYTAATCDALGLILADIAQDIGAGDSQAWLLPLYAGQAYLSWTNSASQDATLTVTVQHPVLGAIPIWSATSGAAAGGPVQITLPRCPCTLTIKNSGTETSAFAAGVTAQEYAS